MSDLILEVIGVSKKFRGLQAVNDLSFKMKQQEIVGLIGPNGAGKTTAFNLIAGTVKADNGEVLFNSQNISNLRPDQICRKGLARTFQLVKPFAKLTVLENVTIGAMLRHPKLSDAREHAYHILKTLGFESKADIEALNLTLPDRKCLEVARALATEPQLLLLDEVMAGLRPTETDAIVDILNRINQEMGIAILLIEHVMRAVMKLSHHVIVLNYGQKIAEGEPEVVTQNPEVLACYLGGHHAPSQ